MDTPMVRRLSKALLGNAYRLELAAAVGTAKGDIVTAQGLATELGIPPNLVSTQLKAFVTASVMADVPRVDGQRYRYYRRLENPYWDLARRLLEAWEAMPMPPGTSVPLLSRPNFNPTTES